MTNYDFSTKDLIDTLSFSTAKHNRDGYMRFIHNGRTYIKEGTYQIVTVVANIYKVYDVEKKKNVKVMLAGISKQSTNDRKHDKHFAESVAATYAQVSPAIVMEVPNNYTKRWFDNFMYHYVSAMDLKFVKTAAELSSEQNDDRNGVKFEFDR